MNADKGHAVVMEYISITICWFYCRAKHVTVSVSMHM